MSNVMAKKLNTGYFDVVYAGEFNALAGQRARKKASHNEVFILSQIDSYGAVQGKVELRHRYRFSEVEETRG